MEKTKTFKELLVWQKSHEFVLKVYKLSKLFPKDELFGLTAQFRRAAVSISANICEGYKKKSNLDKLRFLNIAQGSTEECSYYVILAYDLSYISENQHQELENCLESASILLNKYYNKISENSK
ncbi:four helix bundle protein [Bacteroidia bacterium]|nr:four helix bundle protein [Bacteroidia bacterium]